MEDGIIFDILMSIVFAGMEITFYTFSLFFELIEIIRIDSIFANEATVSLCYSNQNSTFLNKELGCPVSYITKTLDNESFSLETFS